MRELQEWHDVDEETFRNDIVALNEPVVLKALVRDWPVVQHAAKSPAELASYLGQFAAGEDVRVFIGPPEIGGRFFYRDDLKGFNFEEVSRTLMSTLSALSELAEYKDPPAIAMQAAPIPESLPGFCDENKLSLIDESIEPRMWMGNRTITNTHYDTSQNIACAVTGRRRFTFFPPGQMANMYIGPLLLTPGGAHVSMVDVRAPDLSRYPKFSDALDVAMQVTLEPGDAVYIPRYWWHNVESLDTIGMLVNYWWGAAEDTDLSPYQSLLHSLLTIPSLPIEHRKVWRDIFDYCVFQIDQHPAAHLPADLEDIIGDFSPEREKRLMEKLGKQLGTDSRLNKS